MSNKVKVLVVDDEKVSRGFFDLQVRMSRGYELAASLDNAEKAVEWCSAHQADLMIMDVMMKHGLDGLTCSKKIKENNKQIRIILTTSTAEAEWIDKARDAGIEGFWFKEYSEISLTEVMDRTMNGESVYPGDMPNPEFGVITKAQLTRRELDVLRKLTRNLTNKEIAEALHISPFTVKRHIQNMLKKTGYKNRLDLAMAARSSGLVVSETIRTGNRKKMDS